MKEINLEFNGYWREVNKGGVPAESGIYCVYACTYNSAEGTVSLRELMYVGESENVKKRLTDHEKLPKWKNRLRAGETLCYSFANIGNVERIRAEAAIINYHKPPCNTEYINSFPYTTTTIFTSGRNCFLKNEFTVYERW